MEDAVFGIGIGEILPSSVLPTILPLHSIIQLFIKRLLLAYELTVTPPHAQTNRPKLLVRKDNKTEMY